MNALLQLYVYLKLVIIPLCWPDSQGRCACGYGHKGKAIGKGPLIKYKHLVQAPPSTAQILRWFARRPFANAGLLLEPAAYVVIDLDSAAAADEATRLGLPPTIRARRGEHQHHYYHRQACAPAARAIHRGVTRHIDVLSAGYVVLPPSRHRSGQPYEWIVPPAGGVLPDAPGWAIDMLTTGNTPSSRHTTPPVLPVNLPTIEAASLQIDDDTRGLILHGRTHDPGRYPSRSEALFETERRLIRNGYDDLTIAGVLLNPKFQISDKPRERGPDWLATDIARARQVECDSVPEMSPHPSRRRRSAAAHRAGRSTFEVEVG
jgi:Bifunctional DNA primase/polymerase, N-terminal